MEAEHKALLRKNKLMWQQEDWRRLLWEAQEREILLFFCIQLIALSPEKCLDQGMQSHLKPGLINLKKYSVVST